MFSLIAFSLLVRFASSHPSSRFARYDLGRYVNRLSDGRAQSWRERLNVACFASPSRVTFASPEIEAKRDAAALRIRCEVFAERNGYTGRASFGGEA